MKKDVSTYHSLEDVSRSHVCMKGGRRDSPVQRRHVNKIICWHLFIRPVTIPPHKVCLALRGWDLWVLLTLKEQLLICCIVPLVFFSIFVLYRLRLPSPFGLWGCDLSPE